MRLSFAAASLALLWACSPPTPESPTTNSSSPTLTVSIARATDTGPGEALGVINIADSPAGAVFTLDLHGLPPGEHGFHIHQNGDCSAAMDHGAMAPAHGAGGHWDPQNTGRHAGPEGDGHLGDLPRIEADADGAVSASVTAPRITDVTQLSGHALMIHAGGDTYGEPPTLGGGGARIACGVIG